MKRKIDYLFLFYQLLFFSQILIFFTTDTGLILQLLVSVVFWIWKKQKFDDSYIKLFFIFTILFFIPALIFGYWNIPIFVGSFIRILIGFLVVNAYREDLFEIFLNLIILLALLSIVFYFIQIIYPEIFYKFNFLKPFLTHSRAYAGHVNLLLFHYNTWATLRNSGFMWEPAAFGAVLAWALTIHIFKYKFKINQGAIVLLTAMLTTVSIGTYTYLSIFIGLYFINKKNLIGFITSIILLAALILFLSKINFIKQQADYIQRKTGQYQTYTVEEARRANARDVPRTTGFLLDLNYFIANPMGYGFYRNWIEYPRLAGSPCGLSRFFIKWGLLGICILIYGYSKYIKYLGWKYKYKIRFASLLTIVFLLTLFGNPIDYAPFMTVFFLFGLNAKRIVKDQYRISKKIRLKSPCSN